MQNQYFAVSSKLPAPSVIEAGVALFVGHARYKPMIGKQIHLVANSRTIGARQVPDIMKAGHLRPSTVQILHTTEYRTRSQSRPQHHWN